MGRFSGTNLGMMLLALTAACGGSTPATTGSGGATASATSVGSGGGAETASSTGGMGGAAQTTASATVTVGAGGSGGGEFVCNPAAAPGSIYETTGDLYGSAGPASMCKYRGDVMLIVNTAAV